MQTPPALKIWHDIVQTKNNQLLSELLADEVIFHSPVVYTPQVGKTITEKYLTAASHVLFNDTFTYVREITQDNHACLEFTVTLDDIFLNGVDLLTWNDTDQIVDFKVLVRPLKGIDILRQKMAELLKSMG